MIFTRSSDKASDRSVWFVRAASTASLILYPAGALTLALGPDTLGTSVAGYGMILGALIAFASIAGSSLQRVVAEETKQLDEYELQLRHRTISNAYVVMTVLTLLAVLYAAIATDKGGWVPRSYDEFNGLFWGVFLYASALPTFCLAWRLDPSSEAAS